MYLYLIRNKLDGKIYIGQTNNAERRWRCHKSPSAWEKQNGSYLYNAMKKHGVENFIFNILEEFSSENEQETINWGNELELFIIEGLNSTNHDIGYNIECGGKNKIVTKETRLKISLANKGKVPSEETKNKISKTLTGKKASEETKLKLSLIHKGKPSNSKGKNRIFSEEHKLKISLGKKGGIVSEETKDKISKTLMGNIPSNKGKKLVIINGKRTYIKK